MGGTLGNIYLYLLLIVIQYSALIYPYIALSDLDEDHKIRVLGFMLVPYLIASLVVALFSIRFWKSLPWYVVILGVLGWLPIIIYLALMIIKQ